MGNTGSASMYSSRSGTFAANHSHQARVTSAVGATSVSSSRHVLSQDDTRAKRPTPVGVSARSSGMNGDNVSSSRDVGAQEHCKSDPDIVFSVRSVSSSIDRRDGGNSPFAITQENKRNEIDMSAPAESLRDGTGDNKGTSAFPCTAEGSTDIEVHTPFLEGSSNGGSIGSGLSGSDRAAPRNDFRTPLDAPVPVESLGGAVDGGSAGSSCVVPTSDADTNELKTREQDVCTEPKTTYCDDDFGSEGTAPPFFAEDGEYSPTVGYSSDSAIDPVMRDQIFSIKPSFYGAANEEALDVIARDHADTVARNHGVFPGMLGLKRPGVASSSRTHTPLGSSYETLPVLDNIELLQDRGHASMFLGLREDTDDLPRQDPSGLKVQFAVALLSAAWAPVSVPHAPSNQVLVSARAYSPGRAQSPLPNPTSPLAGAVSPSLRAVSPQVRAMSPPVWAGPQTLRPATSQPGLGAPVVPVQLPSLITPVQSARTHYTGEHLTVDSCRTHYAGSVTGSASSSIVRSVSMGNGNEGQSSSSQPTSMRCAQSPPRTAASLRCAQSPLKTATTGLRFAQSPLGDAGRATSAVNLHGHSMKLSPCATYRSVGMGASVSPPPGTRYLASGSPPPRCAPMKSRSCASIGEGIASIAYQPGLMTGSISDLSSSALRFR